ncbi:hypothetical protein SAMN05216188_13213 [Lentzea xinjiangensis]|uniref:Uncharacterized protein n=1 Tax=Lentzea xinjiangensis TaxID=402600 RepID=A0A1H9WBI0_9PSEU|nr:hypothetical protein [Lentzea xinjiangensis]SES31149.1 hypothetical protein SAMN05216188_13213 [Lentzea xinjiangensis]
MTRRTTAAATLVLSAIPAVLALTLFTGTAQADDTPWANGLSGDTPWANVIDDDTPWAKSHSIDTPWALSVASDNIPSGKAVPNDGDTPWADITPLSDDTPWA